ncbi:MAG: hypothetical protein Tsb0019_41060 [Roseibium sp.]
MADYYSILKKTIASLPENNGAARRSVYSRARNAIVNQLKAYEPPLAPSEITAEQLRLEEAIRKVEAEAARESLGLAASAPKVEPPVQTPQPAAAASVSAPQDEPAPQPAAETAPVQDASADATLSPLKETLSEAETLGSAASQAVQSAKDAGEPEPDTVPVRREPAFDSPSTADDGLFEPEEAAGEDAGAEIASGPKASGRRKGRGKQAKPSASEALRGGTGNRLVPVAAAGVLALLLIAGAAYYFLSQGDQVADGSGPVRTAETRTAPAVEPAPASPEPAEAEPGAAATPEQDGSKNTDRLLNDADSDAETDVVAPDARTVTTTTINPQPEPAAPSQPSIVTSVEENAAPAEQPPVAVPEGNLAAISPEDTAPAAPSVASESSVQRSILYEEGEESGGAGTAAQGAVVWTVEEETNLEGQSQSVLSAAVDIPERDVKVEIRIKPNDDTSLPASHLVEIKYEFPEGFAAGDVVNVPGLVMKPTEEARGDALIGASVKVSPGFFWIALSSLPNEQQRNLALLRERGWIDIPMLYENGKRGILTLEKGAAGSAAVEKAVTAWQAG